MEIKEFIEKFAEAIEVDNVDALTPETEFHDLDEWSSISIMLLIAFFDEEFDKQIGNKEIKEADTIQDLYKLATA
jgi:acyl carrier protein